MANINNCTILENGADGIKYVHSDERPDDKLDRTDVFDLCTFPMTSSQTFPVTISMEQNKYALNLKRCPQVSIIFNRYINEKNCFVLYMKSLNVVNDITIKHCLINYAAHLHDARSSSDDAFLANENR